MSITDELREWTKGSTLSSWTAEHLTAIADRIDAQHERAMADAYLSGTPTDEKLTELGWIRLPKDADGVPIHVGDKVTCARSVWQVTGLRLTGLAWGVCCTIFNDHGGSGTNVYPPCDLRHHHAPTVEDVLREFANEVYADADNEIRDRDYLCAKYAKRLTLTDVEDA